MTSALLCIMASTFRDTSHREAERLAAALQLNQPLALAYHLKEDLRQDLLATRQSPHRWEVEACNSWFSRFRKPIVRYEKT